jgi:hypothetical protein
VRAIVLPGPPPRSEEVDPRRYDPAMTKLQWVYVIVGLLIVLSMVLAYVPIGR